MKKRLKRIEDQLAELERKLDLLLEQQPAPWSWPSYPWWTDQPAPDQTAPTPYPYQIWWSTVTSGS